MPRARPKKKRRASTAKARRAPRRRARHAAWRSFSRLPPSVAVVGACAVLLVVVLAVNLVVQVVRKPTELFYPVDDLLAKSPAETWDAYGTLFEAHATRRIEPELLAALAQVESTGNPIARTYWRLSWSARLFDIWRPASSSVGLYQVTDGTFEQARRLCVHDHVVVDDGPWTDLRSCWFNALYTRTVPSHAIEMTSAYLDRSAAAILAREGRRGATSRQVQQLAAVIHLCGAGAAATFARRGFSLTSGQLCGTHPVVGYVTRVERYQAIFRRLRRG